MCFPVWTLLYSSHSNYALRKFYVNMRFLLGGLSHHLVTLCRILAAGAQPRSCFFQTMKKGWLKCKVMHDTFNKVCWCKQAIQRLEQRQEDCMLGGELDSIVYWLKNINIKNIKRKCSRRDWTRKTVDRAGAVLWFRGFVLEITLSCPQQIAFLNICVCVCAHAHTRVVEGEREFINRFNYFLFK